MNLKFTSILILLLGLISCKQADTATRPMLTVSIEPQRKMLESIVGDHYDVSTLLARGSNPETFDPSVQQKMDASRSQAYFMVGFLPFEESLSREMGDNVRIVDTSEGIELVMGTHSHGAEEHAEADPHIWSSFPNAKIMAENMVKALYQLDPANAQEYSDNYLSLCQTIDSLNDAAASRLEASNAHAFAVWHPSLSYYARDYDLHQLALGQESKEASIGNIKRMVDEARSDSVRVFFYQKEYDSRQASTISNEIGARLVPIDPLAYDWDLELMKITDEISR